MQIIIEVMQSAGTPLHLHQIVGKSKQPERVVGAFIREQSAFGNVDVVPTRGRYGSRYEWVGPLPVKEEMLELAKEVDAESAAETQLEPAAKESIELPDSPLAELGLPSDTLETAQEEPALQKPVAMTEAALATTQPFTPKVRYLIQAAKQVAKRFVNEEHKRVEISTIYLYAVAKSGIEVERVW